VGIIRCVTSRHHDAIKALREALGFGPNINRPDLPAIDRRVVMQFMQSQNVTGTLDPFLAMLMTYNGLKGTIGLLSDKSQRSGEAWGQSVSVLVPPDTVQSILSHGYRLRGPAGNLLSLSDRFILPRALHHMFPTRVASHMDK
jgi:hypothetical protein